MRGSLRAQDCGHSSNANIIIALGNENFFIDICFISHLNALNSRCKNLNELVLERLCKQRAERRTD